jgi:hypothetical protein
MSTEKDFDQIAARIDAAIRLLYNSERKTFLEIFGVDNGGYLWDKFTGHYKANEGAFICYLDYNNQRKLAQAAHAYALKNDSRTK